MLKAVKESMKNWLKSHERLYWYIVVGIAVLAFGIITAVGCAKLEKAHAAQTYCAPEEAYEIIMESFVSKFGEGKINTHTYYALTVTTTGWYNMQISTTPFYVVNTAGYNQLWYDGTVYHGSLSPTGVRDVELTGTTASQNRIRLDTPSTVLMCNHNLYLGDFLYREKDITVEYFPDAPYTNFQRVAMKYGYEAEKLSNFYRDWMLNNEWTYYGHLNNIQEGIDLSYSIAPKILVQLPTVEYILGAFSAEGIDLTVDSDLGIGDMYRFYKCIPDLVRAWYNDKKAPYVEYEFEYAFDLVPDANGNFVYTLSLSEIETLIKYFNADVLEEFKGYSEHFRAVYMTFAHVRSVTSMVETVRADSIVYGKLTTNQFGRGVFDTCVEVIPDIDFETMTPEEMDKIVEDATAEAHDKYIKDLEDRLDKLESELGGMSSIDSAFSGNLEATDLWSGFRSLVDGLASLAPSIRSIAVLTGAVFAFLPVTVTGIMATTLFGICIIAIIKAIRG